MFRYVICFLLMLFVLPSNVSANPTGFSEPLGVSGSPGLDDQSNPDGLDDGDSGERSSNFDCIEEGLDGALPGCASDVCLYSDEDKVPFEQKSGKDGSYYFIPSNQIGGTTECSQCSANTLLMFEEMVKSRNSSSGKTNQGGLAGALDQCQVVSEIDYVRWDFDCKNYAGWWLWCMRNIAKWKGKIGGFDMSCVECTNPDYQKPPFNGGIGHRINWYFDPETKLYCAYDAGPETDDGSSNDENSWSRETCCKKTLAEAKKCAHEAYCRGDWFGDHVRKRDCVPGKLCSYSVDECLKICTLEDYHTDGVCEVFPDIEEEIGPGVCKKKHPEGGDAGSDCYKCCYERSMSYEPGMRDWYRAACEMTCSGKDPNCDSDGRENRESCSMCCLRKYHSIAEVKTCNELYCSE